MKGKMIARGLKKCRRKNECRSECTLSSTVVLRGRTGATVYGCRRILCYTPQRIVFRVGKEALSVCGEDLYCTSFSSGTVSLEGSIRTISFEVEERELPDHSRRDTQ